MNVQFALDCADPHALARFYAAGFGYVVEDADAQVRQLLESGILDRAEVVEIDGRLAFRSGAGCRHPDGNHPRLLFQLSDDAKVGKNRGHLDFQLGADGLRDEAVERLLGLGARKLWEASQGPVHAWVTMADPEGNEFCVTN